jgi:hypothetical protein
MQSNNAMHLSRNRKAIFLFEHKLRAGDGQRYAKTSATLNTWISPTSP